MNPQLIVGLIAEKLLEFYKVLQPLTESLSVDPLLQPMIYLSNASCTPEQITQSQEMFRALISVLGLSRLLSDLYCTHTLSHAKCVNAIILTFGEKYNTLIRRMGELKRLILFLKKKTDKISVCLLEKWFIKKNVPETWYQKPKKETKVDPSLRVIGSNSLGTSIYDMEVATTGGSSAVEPSPASGTIKEPSTEPVNPNDPRVKNARMIWYLASELPSVLGGLFKGILKLLFSRRISESSNRKTANLITENIATAITGHIQWKRPELVSQVASMNFMKSMLNYVSSLLVEDRNVATLHTPFALNLIKVGYVDKILEITCTIWEHLSLNGSQEELKDVYFVLERCFEFLNILCNNKLLLDSAHTTTLLREKDRKSPEYFDPHQHVVFLRLKILPVLKKLLDSPIALHSPASIIRPLTSTLVHIYKSEGEASGTSAGGMAPWPFPTSSLFGQLSNAQSSSHAPAPIVADPDKVQQICDMGFPQSAAQRALVLTGNNVNRATEYLLTHPEILDEPPSTSAAPAAVPAAAAASSSVPAETTSIVNPTSENTNVQPSASVDTPMEDAFDENSDEDHEDDEDPEDDDEDDDDPEDMDDEESLARALVFSLTGKSNQDKGKEKETSLKPELDSLRESFKESILNRCFELLVSVPDAIFEIKDVICLLSKDISGIVSYIFTGIDKTKAQDSQNKLIGTYLRLLALITNDVKFQKEAIQAIKPCVSKITSMIQEHFTDSAWTSSLFLIIESCLSFSDEPQKEPLDPRVILKSNENQDKDLKKDLGDFLDSEQRLVLLDEITRHLKNEIGLGKDLLFAILRMLVRLTRSFDLALRFAQNEGVSHLLKPQNLLLFSSQQQLILIIFRNIIESPNILKREFEFEIRHWFYQNKSRGVDINSFLKQFNYLSCRNPDIFVQVVKSICKLAKYDSSGRHYNIILKPKPSDVDVSPSEKAEKSEKDLDMKDATSSVQSTFATLESSEGVSIVLKSLIHDLLSIKSSFKEQDEKSNLCRCFLLQVLSELAISYPECRKEIVFSTQRRSSKTPTKSVPKNSLLHYVVNSVLSFDIKSLETDQTKVSTEITLVHMTQNTWSYTLLCALCLEGQKDPNDKTIHPDITNTRRAVIEFVGKSLKECISASYSSIEQRYERYLSLAELVSQILSYKPHKLVSSREYRNDETLPLAKIMLEKGFVNTLTGIVADLDIYYPLTKLVLPKILKPIEHLSKLAIKIGSSVDESSTKKDSVDSQVVPPESQVESQAEVEDNHRELSNIYRSSALSMFGPRSDNDDLDQSDDEEDGFEDFSDEDSMEDIGEEDEVSLFLKKYLLKCKIGL